MRDSRQATARRPEVVKFGLDLVCGVHLARAVEGSAPLVEVASVMLSVRLAELCGAVATAVECVLADERVEVEAALGNVHKGLIGERVKHRRAGAGDGLRCAGRKRAVEHCECLHARAFWRAEPAK